MVHKQTLCSHSPYFNNIFQNPRWAKSGKTSTTLEEYEAVAFEIYAHWVYADRVDVSCPRGPDSAEKHHQLLVDLHNMGIFFGDLEFCNVIMYSFIHFSCQPDFMPGPAIVRLVYEQATPESKLRPALLDLIVPRVQGPLFCKTIHEYPAEFLLEALKRTMMMIRDRVHDRNEPMRKMKKYYH